MVCLWPDRWAHWPCEYFSERDFPLESWDEGNRLGFVLLRPRLSARGGGSSCGRCRWSSGLQGWDTPCRSSDTYKSLCGHRGRHWIHCHALPRWGLRGKSDITNFLAVCNRLVVTITWTIQYGFPTSIRHPNCLLSGERPSNSKCYIYMVNYNGVYIFIGKIRPCREPSNLPSTCSSVNGFRLKKDNSIVVSCSQVRRNEYQQKRSYGKHGVHIYSLISLDNTFQNILSTVIFLWPVIVNSSLFSLK